MQVASNGTEVHAVDPFTKKKKCMQSILVLIILYILVLEPVCQRKTQVLKALPQHFLFSVNSLLLRFFPAHALMFM